jgi:hypothetical protein
MSEKKVDDVSVVPTEDQVLECSVDNSSHEEERVTSISSYSKQFEKIEFFPT